MPVDRLIILTGASGSGKTTLARAIEREQPDRQKVCYFDSIGVPAPDIIHSYGSGHQPGGAWQRAMTLDWMERIAWLLGTGASVLFEGQMRPAFIQEALEHCSIPQARVVLVDCSDEVRASRLRHDRSQPELANDNMMHWAQYLRDEARQYAYEVLDTGACDFAACLTRLQRHHRD